MSEPLTPADFVLLRRAVDMFAAFTAGKPFMIGEASIRAALFPEAVLIEYEDLGRRFDISPSLLPAVLIALGGCVLTEAMRLREIKALEVPPNAPLN